MSKSVWVIEQGSYSDYRVVGVFTSREEAQLVADAIRSGYDEPTIAKWPLNPGVKELRQGFSQFNIHMLYDGRTERADHLKLSGYEIGEKVEIWRRTEAPAYKGKGIPDVLTAIVWAKNMKHAVKIVNEHRLKMIAGGRFKP